MRSLGLKRSERERKERDAQGALGHLDMGWGYAVGADNFNPSPNATILLKFPVTSTQRPVGPVVHFNKRWDMAAANHVAHGNARSDAALEQQVVCSSNATRQPVPRANEVVCYRLDGSLDVLVVARQLACVLPDGLEHAEPGVAALDGDEQ